MSTYDCVHKHCEFGGMAGPVAQIITDETIAATEDTTRADAIERVARAVLDWHDNCGKYATRIEVMQRLRDVLANRET